MLTDSISNIRSLLLAVSRVERGKETRHTRTSTGSHHLRVVADVPSRVLHKKNPQSSRVKHFQQVFNRLVLATEGDREGLIFHVMLQCASIWPIKKRFIHINCHRFYLDGLMYQQVTVNIIRVFFYADGIEMNLRMCYFNSDAACNRQSS